MQRARRRALAWMLVGSGGVWLLALALGDARAEPANAFTISRVQVFLSARVKSEVLTMRNVSSDTLRFQLEASSWDQAPDGEMVLAPTKDIVFFPRLFTLAPGEERNIRVGAATPPAPVEKTYRLFIEELPRVDGASPASQGQVAIRTRLGIPIFMRPPGGRIAGRLDDVAVRDGRVLLTVRNTGSVHFVVHGVRLTGHDEAGQVVVERALEGWYVLAGGSRAYQLELPGDVCEAVRALSIEVQTSQAAYRERLDVASAAACRR